MTLKKFGLSVLFFSTLLATVGGLQQINATASSTNTSTTSTTQDVATPDPAHHPLDEVPGVWGQMTPSFGQVQLTDPNAYTLYNEQGDRLTDTMAGGKTTDADGFILLLTPENAANFFVRVGDNQYIKFDSTVILDISDGSNDTLTTDGGLTPTNFIVKFVDQNNKDIQKSIVLPISSVKSDQTSYLNPTIAATMTLLHNDLTQVTYNIKGYTPRATNPVTSDGDYITTFHYVKQDAPVTPGGNTTSNTTSTVDSSSTSSESTSSEQPASQPAPVKETTVYATKAIGLYKTPTFTKSNRQHFYNKHARTNRPQFVVTGYARSKNGLLRYRVRDTHHAQWQGYITANSTYVTNTYYQTNPKTIKVLSRHGINAYNQASLKGKAVKHYARGTSLKVKAVKSYHLTNRFMLSNGHYISANKTLVIKK